MICHYSDNVITLFLIGQIPNSNAHTTIKQPQNAVYIISVVADSLCHVI